MSVGNYGFSWSSATSATSGMGLDFHAQGLTPNYANTCDHGIQLRCLSE